MYVNEMSVNLMVVGFKASSYREKEEKEMNNNNNNRKKEKN